MGKIKKTAVVFLIVGGEILSGLAGCGQKEDVYKEFSNPDNIIEEFKNPDDIIEEFSNNSEEVIKLNAQVADVYGDAEAIVTIISDDGFYASGENLNKIFRERGLKCTVAGAIRIVEPELDSWKTLLEDGTINLVSHSYNHIRMEDGTAISQDTDALKHEIVDADRWYEDTFGEEQIVFVCPENQMCELGYEILGDNSFWAVRKGKRGYNSLSPEEGTEAGQWFNLMVQGVNDDGVDISVRNNWVDTAIDDRVWLIEMWHNVMPEDDGGYQTILIPEAEEHLDYIKVKSEGNAIWVATFDEAVKYIREKQNVEITAYIDGNKLYVYAEFMDDEISYSTFNQPLTVYVDIPDGWTVEQTDEIKQSDGRLMLDVVPGEEQAIGLIEE